MPVTKQLIPKYMLLGGFRKNDAAVTLLVKRQGEARSWAAVS